MAKQNDLNSGVCYNRLDDIMTDKQTIEVMLLMRQEKVGIMKYGV